MMKRLVVILSIALLSSAAPLAPPEHQRPADQTFLTYPEWFLVFSPAEYATFVNAKCDPSDFPFIGHIRQFWRGYDAVWSATRGRYPFNGGYHLMIMVIGVSTTGEYLVRSAYENLIGRLAELTRSHGPTKEDLLAARVAQEYVDFIRIWPWYEFDFKSRLVRLWKTTGLTGPDMIRKWERKYALTSEYGAKAIYGWMIGKATRAGYERPLPVTSVVVDHLPSVEIADLQVLRPYSDGSALVTIPRYEAFMRPALELARRGTQFREIAGNRGTILISVLARGEVSTPDRILLRQPILTEPGTERLLVTVPIASLAPALQRYSREPFRLEHVFDF